MRRGRWPPGLFGDLRRAGRGEGAALRRAAIEIDAACVPIERCTLCADGWTTEWCPAGQAAGAVATRAAGAPPLLWPHSDPPCPWQLFRYRPGCNLDDHRCGHPSWQTNDAQQMRCNALVRGSDIRQRSSAWLLVLSNPWTAVRLLQLAMQRLRVARALAGLLVEKLHCGGLGQAGVGGASKGGPFVLVGAWAGFNAHQARAWVEECGASI